MTPSQQKDWEIAMFLGEATINKIKTNNMSNRIYQDAIKLWGEKSQLEMAQEEATELALAVRKFIRQPTPERFQALASEIADVEIMIEQVKFIYPQMERESQKERKIKLMRLEERIEKQQFES